MRRFGLALAALFGVLATGSVGFHLITHEGWLSSFYRTLITVSLMGLDSEPPGSGAKALTTQATWDGILDAYATSLAGQISAALGASGQKPAPDLREKIRKDLNDTVRYDQAIQLQARALASRFSPDELGQLEKFYRSGPGKNRSSPGKTPGIPHAHGGSPLRGDCWKSVLPVASLHCWPRMPVTRWKSSKGTVIVACF